MWIPLHVHSQYSILDSSASIPQIVKQSKEYGLPAVALTDHGNLFGAVDFYKECKGAGIKAIIGCDFYEASGLRTDKKKQPGERVAHSLVLLAKDKQGYHNLCKLSSIGYLEGFYYHPRIDREVLQRYSQGLICLSGPLSTRIGQEAAAGRREACVELVR